MSQNVSKLGENLKVRIAKYERLREEKIKIEKKIDQHNAKISESNLTMDEREEEHNKQEKTNQHAVDKLAQEIYSQQQNIQ